MNQTCLRVGQTDPAHGHAAKRHQQAGDAFKQFILLDAMDDGEHCTRSSHIESGQLLDPPQALHLVRRIREGAAHAQGLSGFIARHRGQAVTQLLVAARLGLDAVGAGESIELTAQKRLQFTQYAVLVFRVEALPPCLEVEPSC